MLNPDQYSDQKLDKNTRDQLFQLFVEENLTTFQTSIKNLKQDVDYLRSISTKLKEDLTAIKSKDLKEDLRSKKTLSDKIKSWLVKYKIKTTK